MKLKENCFRQWKFSHSKVIKSVNDPLRAGEECAKEILGNLEYKYGKKL